MLNLKDYMWNAFEIKQNNPDCGDNGVAYDMLRNNIKWGEAVDQGTNLPWETLKKHWDAMTADEQRQSRKEFHMCFSPVLWPFFESGDRVGFEQKKIELFYEAVAAEEAAKEAAQEEGQ